MLHTHIPCNRPTKIRTSFTDVECVNHSQASSLAMSSRDPSGVYAETASGQYFRRRCVLALAILTCVRRAGILSE